MVEVEEGAGAEEGEAEVVEGEGQVAGLVQVLGEGPRLCCCSSWLPPLPSSGSPSGAAGLCREEKKGGWETSGREGEGNETT